MVHEVMNYQEIPEYIFQYLQIFRESGGTFIIVLLIILVPRSISVLKTRVDMSNNIKINIYSSQLFCFSIINIILIS